MSSPTPSDKTRKFYPTAKFVTEEEKDIAIQLFGLAHTHSEPTSGSRKMLNEFLKKLGEKYGYDWEHMSVAPNGELVRFEDVEQ